MTNGSKIKIRRSATGGSVPSTTNLADGELALNTYDGKLFFKKTVGITESIITLEPQIQYSAGTGVSISEAYAISIGQSVGTTDAPTFAGATLNGITSIKQSAIGTQNALKVSGYVGSAGSVFAVGVSSVPSDGVNLQSLTYDLANPAKLNLSGSSIVLNVGSNQWTFNNSGNIQLPANGNIIDSYNNSVLKYPTVKKVTFDNPIAYKFGAVPFTTATATNSSNNNITVDDSSIFTVGSPIVFYGITSFGGIQKSLQFPIITTYFVLSIPDSKTITISDTFDGSIFAVSTASGKMIVSTNISLAYGNVYSIDSNNSHITIDDTSIFNVGDIVTFYAPLVYNDSGVTIRNYGSLLINGTYYIRTIVDSTTITLTDTPNGATDIVLTSYSSDTDSPNGPMVMTRMSSNSYQIQRAPRLFTPYDSLETTGYDLSALTYGDMLYEDPNLFVMVDLGYGTPQRFSLTPPS
jgi:hypothetical protein